MEVEPKQPHLHRRARLGPGAGVVQQRLAQLELPLAGPGRPPVELAQRLPPVGVQRPRDALCDPLAVLEQELRGAERLSSKLTC
jgi:hypothetical protein